MNRFFTALLLAATLFTSGCSGDDAQEVDDFNSDDYLYFVSGKIDGETFFYGQSAAATSLEAEMGFTLPSENVICVYAEQQGLEGKFTYSTGISPSYEPEDNQPAFDFEFERFLSCQDEQSPLEAFNFLFTTGSYDFSAEEGPYGPSRQVALIYYPKDAGSLDAPYSTYGSAGSGNTFTITKTEEANTYFGQSIYDQRQQLEGTFTATLTREDDPTKQVKITGGRFKIEVGR